MEAKLPHDPYVLARYTMKYIFGLGISGDHTAWHEALLGSGVRMIMAVKRCEGKVGQWRAVLMVPTPSRDGRRTLGLYSALRACKAMS